MSAAFDALYADITSHGGIGNALQSAFRETGSALTVSGFGEKLPFAYARVKLGSRSSQVFLAANERLFLFDFWSRGVQFANGESPEIVEVVRALNTWVGSDCKTEHLAKVHSCVKICDTAGAYERGKEVEMRWQMYSTLSHTDYRDLEQFTFNCNRKPRTNRGHRSP